MSDITPDLNPVNVTPYLSVVPDRWQQKQKVHRTLGHAKAAISNRIYGRQPSRRDYQIYQYGESGWELLYDIPKGTTADNLPWRKK